MKLKKQISLVLALCMIISLLPAMTLPAAAADKFTVTYTFKNGGRTDIPSAGKGLEEFRHVSGELDGGVYEFVKNAQYAAFPKDDWNVPGDWWAYLGTNTYMSLAPISAVGGSAHFLRLDTGYLAPTKQQEGAWIAFRIKVPEDGIYKVSGGSMYSYHNATPELEFYVVPYEGTLKAALEDEKTYGDISASPIGTAYYGYRTNAKAFSDFGDLSSYYMGKANIYSNPASGYGDYTVTDNAREQELDGNKEYVLFLHSKQAGAATISSLTLEYKLPPPPALTDIETSDIDILVGNKISPVVVWKSDGTEIDGRTGTVSLEVLEDANNALLLGQDGNLYARREGEATVRVTGILDGNSAYKDITVTVSEDRSFAGVNETYFFFLGGYADTGTAISFSAPELNAETFAQNFRFSDYGEVRPWGLVAAQATRPSGSGAFFPHDSKYLDLSGNAGDWVAFKVKVPKAGKYTIDVNAYCYQNGGLAEIYMLPYDEEVMTFQNITDNIDTYASSETFAGAADTYLADTTKAGPAMQTGVGSFVADANLDYSRGYTDYLMIIKSEYSKIYNIRYCVLLNTINIVGEGGIAEAEVGLTDEAIGVGETLSITDVSAENGAGGNIPLDGAYIEHNVQSGSEEILELQSDGITFKAKANGEAVIETLILIDGCAFVKENKITVSEETHGKKAYLYNQGNVVVGKALELTTTLELNNRKVLNMGEIVSLEIVSQSPEESVIVLTDGGKGAEAIGAGSAEIRAVVNARGVIYTTDPITVTVTPIDTPYPANFTMSFYKNAFSGEVPNYLTDVTKYSSVRNWIFHEIKNGTSEAASMKLSTTGFTNIFFNTAAQPNYIAFKAVFTTPGKYTVDLKAWFRDRAPKVELYLVPYSLENNRNLGNLLVSENEYYFGSLDNYVAQSDAGYYTQKLGEGEIKASGEYLIVFKIVKGQSASGDVWYPESISFKNNSVLNTATLVSEDNKTEIEVDDTLTLSPKIFGGDGSEIEYAPEDITVTYSSANESVATVSTDGVVTGVNEGNAKITADVTYNGTTVKAEFTVKVKDSSEVDLSLGITATVNPDTIFAYASTQIKLHVAMQSGRWVEIPSDYITYEIVSGEDFATVSADGTVTGRLVGDIVIQPVVDANYKENISKIEIAPITVRVLWDSTLTPSIYTIDERENAIQNAKKYSWAKAEAKNAATRADKYADNLDMMYNMVVPEGLPRYYHIGHKYDPLKFSCRYCGVDIAYEYGSYGFIADPMTREWKVQCPDCKRLFPSNDFGSFYKLGITDSGKWWDYAAALQKHHELFVCADGENCTCTDAPHPTDKRMSAEWIEYYGFGKGYLANSLYEEMDEKLGTVGWGVDDSLGYMQPYVSDPTLPGYDPRYYNKDGFAWYNDGGNAGPVQHTYIAYYLHEGVWYGNGVSHGALRIGINSLKTAFVYTGDIKYGRAGAILLDRIADVYPDMDWYMWATFRGDGYRGNICDTVWSSGFGEILAECADAFLPVYNDPFVVEYLSEHGVQYETDGNGNWEEAENGVLTPVNLKDSPGALRKNVEDNILLTIFDHMKKGMLSSNFGSPQATITAAAIALNRMPETAEMLDWMMKSGTWYETGTVRDEPIGGGNVMSTLMNDVTRDGVGNENAPHYNSGWISNLMSSAEMLADYDGYTKANLFDNPKFIKMLTAHIRMTLGNYYCVQIGDSDSTANSGIRVTQNSLTDGPIAYKYTKDRLVARALYLFNGNTAEGLHYSILDDNPESLADEIEQIVEEDGELNLGSDMMTGFGFAALRAGAVHNSANSQTANNTSRDFAIYFGGSGGHGHLDSLNLFMDAYGLNIAPDLGYPEETGWSPNRYEWVRTTISHNTVVVDEKEQSVKAVSGTPYHFDDNGRVRVMDVGSEAYDNTDDYRRTVFMVDVNDDISYGVDFFHVKGGRDHLYSFHSQSDDLTVVKGLSDMEATPMYTDEDGNLYGVYAGADVVYGADPGGVHYGRYPRGYTWMKNVRTFNSIDKDFSVEYKVKDWNKVLSQKKDIRLRLTMVNDEPMKEVSFVTALAPQTVSNKNIGELEYLLVRNTGTNLDTTFTTVFEPYEAGNEYVASIDKVSMVRDENAKPGTNDSYGAVKVTLKSGRTDYVIYSTNSEVDYIVDNKINFRGFGGVLSLETLNDVETIVASYLNDGEMLELISDPKESSIAAVTGKITSFTDTLSMTNYITFMPEQEIDANTLAGKYVYVDNDGVQNGAYPIESARKLDGGEIELCTGDVTLIRSYIDANDIDAGYVYNIQSGQTLRIPLSASWDSSPRVEAVADTTTSVGSSITVPISAYSPVDKDIELIGTTLPRGMSINAEKMTLTWKPDKSQVGENHVAVTVTDGTMETTVHFTVTVYGSTTGGNNTTDENTETVTPSAGGGGGAAPTDKPGADDENSENAPDMSGETDSIRFTDITNHAWAEDAINSLADVGIIKGTSETTFSPANNITRADFALLLVRAFNLTSDNAENFADVSATDYFAPELAIARNTGIVNGIGDNKYAPRNTITRQDMMVMVHRALVQLGKLTDEITDTFAQDYPDIADVAPYADEAVSALIDRSLVNGKSGRIAPMDYTTRAEVAVLIKRILDYIN